VLKTKITDQECKILIAMNVGKGLRAVERWLSNWNKRRTASVFSGHEHKNNAGKLTNDQAQIKTVLAQPPSEYGIPKEIKSLLHAPAWEVFACDEVKMQQDAIIRKCWLKKGESSVIKVDRDKRSQSYIGFLNQNTYGCHLYEMP
jgi:hypothetical protein